MTYRLLEGESVQESLRRIGCEQIEKAGEDLDGAADDLHHALHEFRKRCKKIRGLIRLVRPAFPDYAEENAWFRDRAAEVSRLRDATSMQECLAALIERYRNDLAAGAFDDVADWLEARRAAMTDESETLAVLAGIRCELPAAAERAAEWQLEDTGREAIKAGLGKTYKRARKGLATARREGTAEAYHEWRKRVKYYRYQSRLISTAWPRILKAIHKEARYLSDLLGDDHDLAVFRQTLVDEAPESIRHAALLALVDRRSEELRRWSVSVGERLFVYPPDVHAGGIGAVLAAWQREQEPSDLLTEEAARVYS